MSREVIACNTSEDLFSPFTSYIMQKQMILVSSNSFFFSPRGNKLTYMFHSFPELEMVRQLKEGFAKPKANLILTWGKIS